MAIAKGKQSTDSQEFKRYIGVAPMFIKAVNPSKAEHETLFNTILDEAPNYVTTITDSDGNEVKNARISVVFQPDVDKIGFDMPLVTMALFIQQKYRYNKDKTKIQVIDKYGRTAWPTIEQAKAKQIPLDKSGNPIRISSDYRPAYIGEEDFVKFVKCYLCIDDVDVWDESSRKFVSNPKVNPDECECVLTNIAKIFTGDFSEIEEALGYQPTNKIKVMLGVRTDAETGRMFQSVYTKRFMKNGATNYSSFDKDIQEMVNNAAANGRTLNTVYEATSVHEYNVEPTQFTPNQTTAPSELPLEDGSMPW